MTIAVFNSDELHILKKIWEDLSERTDFMGINKQTFLKYIPMNGLLGERLFLQFDKEGTGYISLENFINGLCILCLGTVNEQAKFLFEIFDVNNSGLVSKQDLITILNYIPTDTFCDFNLRKRTMSVETLDDFMTYTNSCYCENAFVHHKDYLDFDDFKMWIKHTPAILGYIKSVIPCMSEDEIDEHSDRMLLWKKGEKTGLMIKRYFALRGNCMYYYYNNTHMRPKGIIFLAGSIVESINDNDMESRGYYGFEILHQDQSPESEHYHHEKRVFYCESQECRNKLVHNLQHLSQIVPFEEDYVMGKKIGVGAFSEVHECTNIKTQQLYAVKIINKKIFDRVSRDQLNNEIAILKLVTHPNIIHLKDTYEDKGHIYIVTELVKDGDFCDYISGKPCFKDDLLRIIIKQLLDALAYLHEFGIVHCDIKTENMLYDKETGNIIKLTDFGLSRMIFSNQKLDDSPGTLDYVAPEVISKLGYGMEADMWSLGVVMFMLACGKLPFEGNTPDEMLFCMTKYDLQFKPTISQDAKNLILSLLHLNPKKRISAKDALLHPFIVGRQNEDIVNTQNINFEDPGLDISMADVQPKQKISLKKINQPRIMTPLKSFKTSDSDDDAPTNETINISKKSTNIYDINEEVIKKMADNN